MLTWTFDAHEPPRRSPLTTLLAFGLLASTTACGDDAEPPEEAETRDVCETEGCVEFPPGSGGNPETGDPCGTDGCETSETDDPETGDPETGDPATGDPCDTDGCEPQDTDDPELDGPAQLAACAEESGIALDCVPGEDSWRFVGHSDATGCFGAIDSASAPASVLFRLDETIEGVAQIRGLRLGTGDTDPTTLLAEFTTESPLPYDELANEPLDWTAYLQPSLVAAPFTFLYATSAESTLTIEDLPPFLELETGRVRGTFAVDGGDVVAHDGTPQDSEGFLAAGCFDLPAQALPLEL